MKNTIKFTIALLATLALAYFLNNPIPNRSTDIPALGKLLNPFSGFWQNAESVATGTVVDISIPGLTGEVEVVYDDRLVPHIYADNIIDATYVQGYIIAQNRLWQMDISTRATVGRLAEIMGDNVIERDKTQRRMGMGFAADNAVAAWEKDPEMLEILSAYRDGINAYVSQLKAKDYPIEFKLLNYKPEPWTIKKTAIFIKSMAAVLCFREDDLEATNALNHFGKEIFDDIYPAFFPDDSPIIPVDTKFEFGNEDVSRIDLDQVPTNDISYRPFAKPDPFVGSNNWAVAGSKTASGNPILCNDPHLSLTLPSVWYEIQLHTPEINAYGVSLPGVPGIIIGFNEDIAWGQTNVGQDVTDWYNIKWADDNKTSYLLDGEALPVTWRIEEIKTKTGQTIIDSVKYTVWGPVVYETDDPHADMALQWLAHSENSSDELKTFLGLNAAKNYDDYAAALEYYIAPAQNYVFASKEGDIALKVNGRLPIKKVDQGRFVQDGSLSANSWQGFIPMDQVAYSKNPARGFVASANQQSTSADYPYPYVGNFSDYRGRILNRKLAAMDNITVKDMMALQNDDYSLKAEESLPYMIAAMAGKTLSAEGNKILNELKSWNYNYGKDMSAPIYYQQWYSDFYKGTWDEVYTVDEELPMLFPDSWRTIQLLSEDASNIFFDDKSTEVVESASDIVQQAFDKMVAEMAKRTAESKSMKWFESRDTRIGHIGRIPAFASEVIANGGSRDGLNAMGKTTGPSWRMIVELGDEIEAYGVYPGGQSGNPGSPFYQDMLPDWTAGKYNKLNFAASPEAMADKTILTQHFN